MQLLQFLFYIPHLRYKQFYLFSLKSQNKIIIIVQDNFIAEI